MLPELCCELMLEYESDFELSSTEDGFCVDLGFLVRPRLIDLTFIRLMLITMAGFGDCECCFSNVS